jgi:acetoin utilization protein AcuB
MRTCVAGKQPLDRLNHMFVQILFSALRLERGPVAAATLDRRSTARDDRGYGSTSTDRDFLIRPNLRYRSSYPVPGGSDMRHMPQMLVVMTPFPYHIDAGASLAEARMMMEEHDIRHLPIFGNGDIVGLISEVDLERVRTPGHSLRDETELKVGDLCTNEPYFVDVSDPLDRVLDAMAAQHLDSTLVLREGELAGVFTAADAYRLLAARLREQFPPPTPGTEAA